MTITIDEARDILADHKWEHPSDYGGFSPDGDYVILGRNRDSDALSRSNYRVAYRELNAVAYDAGYDDDSDERPDVYDWRAGHWAVGWVEYLMVRENAPDAVVIEAAEMVAGLSDYPVLDEEDMSELESEEADEVWSNCFDWQERIAYIREHGDQFEFVDFASMIAVVRGDYFAGYASELLYQA